ncbi:MAG: HEAT repeat domain-containing protein [Planctomycetaceae bacterium]|nr:HEAT repeat domain-containing protein [Planctomycetaceae bacterium]
MTDTIPPGDDLRTEDLPIEDLPPIEPPSAGFIVQLFIVPLLIVSVVFGVYVLFAKMASVEADWRQLVTDVRSENRHIRWRAALGLAQLLEADHQQIRRGSSAQPRTRLAENHEVAEALADLYEGLAQKSTPTEEETLQIEFLSKTLGLVDVDDVAIPTLLAGASPEVIPVIRKHSTNGLTFILGRRHAADGKYEHPELQLKILEMSREPELLVRHQATYLLGLLATPAALGRAEELLDDGDDLTRVNAAIALARNDSTTSLPTFLRLLQDAVEWKLDPGAVETPASQSEYFERSLMIKNSLEAVNQLRSQLTAENREQFAAALQAFAASCEDIELRNKATELQLNLQ